LKPAFWEVPEQWPGSTVVVIGGGRSLTAAQVEWVRLARARGECRVIGINDAYRLASWLDILYFCDNKWWAWHRERLAGWAGLIVRLESPQHDWSDTRIKVLKNYNEGGVIDCRDGVAHGSNSGYQAAHLAIHLGAKRIVLLGIDVKCDGSLQHWFGNHPDRASPPDYARWKKLFATMVEPAQKRGIEIINCSPGSALECFRKDTIDRVLPDPPTAALSP